MVNEVSNIIIDDEFILNVETSTIENKSNQKNNKSSSLYLDDINEIVDRLEDSIMDLENSLDPRSVSRMSYGNREGIYLKEGFLTNVVLGVIIALILIILLL